MNVHIVSHTHWDREWYLTHEQTRLRFVAFVDRLLDLMESRADYASVHLDGQAILVEDYLELRPRQEPRLRSLIEQGRILIGPWYVLPDEFLVSGESLVRNFALGHQVASRFGVAMPVGYLAEVCGHVAQMPQILRQFGVNAAMLSHSGRRRNMDSWWEAPDGSRVLLLHAPSEGYGNTAGVHANSELMIHGATRIIQGDASRTALGEVLLMNSIGFLEPHFTIAERLSDTLGTVVRHSTLPAYATAVRSALEHGPRSRLHVVKGELRVEDDDANLLTGVLSARADIKQANARVQTSLERRAEPLATFAWMLGARYPAEELAHAWNTLMQTHAHKSIGGCCVDAVRDENMVRFARAEQVAHAVIDVAANRIARAVPSPPGNALRLIALNTTGQPFTGTVEASVDLPYGSIDSTRQANPEALDAPIRFWPVDAPVAAVASHEGKRVPFQVLGFDYVTSFVMGRDETPLALRARRLRLAWHGHVPACGYASFDVTIGPPLADAPAVQKARAGERAAENAFVRLSLNDDGTVDVVDRRTGTRYARCGELEDVGDVGDTYNYSPPAADRRITSVDAANVRISRVHAGPLRFVFRIDLALPLPVSASTDRGARSSERIETPVTIFVSLDADAPRIGWHVIVRNQARDHRLRLLFPVGVESVSEVRAETAFGVSRRPARRPIRHDIGNDLPARCAPTVSFTEAGGERTGAIVFGDGLLEYDVQESEGGAWRLGVTLLRCVGDLSRDDLVARPSGLVAPGLPTPAAQCPGVHEFRIGFEPRAEAPAASALFARAASFVVAPHVVTLPAEAGSHKGGAAEAGSHKGGAAEAGNDMNGPGERLAGADTFIRLERVRGAVVLSACQRAESRDTVLVRVFNPDDTPASARITARRPLTQAFRVDFLQNRLEELTVKSGAVDVTVGPHRIATIELALADSRI